MKWCAACLSVANKICAKRKRLSSERKLSSSSNSDDAREVLSESELSESSLQQSRNNSPAEEEEPPSKRKRDKNLKTVSQRNRRRVSDRPAETAVLPDEQTTVGSDESGENPTRDDAGKLAETEIGDGKRDRGSSDLPGSCNKPQDDLNTAGQSGDKPVGETDDGEVIDKTADDVSSPVKSPQHDDDDSRDIEKTRTDVNNETQREVEEESNEKSAMPDREADTDSCNVGKETETGNKNQVEGNENSNRDTAAADDALNDSAETVKCGDSDNDDDDDEHDKNNDTVVEADEKDPTPKSTPRKPGRKGRKKRRFAAGVKKTAPAENGMVEKKVSRSRGVKKSRIDHVLQDDQNSQTPTTQSEDDGIALVELRRSSRVNKGQRKFDYVVIEEPSPRKCKRTTQDKENKNGDSNSGDRAKKV